jgi:hypothetical protein
MNVWKDSLRRHLRRLAQLAELERMKGVCKMENTGIKESTKPEPIKPSVPGTRELWILFGGKWIPFDGPLPEEARKQYHELGYRTRLLPFVKLQLCQCNFCRTRYDHKFLELDGSGQPCIQIFACEAKLKPDYGSSILIGRTYSEERGWRH